MNKNRETLMKFISAQNQKVQDDISKQGYKDNSPYRNNPFNIIQGTPQGTSITMDGVSKRLYATDGQTSKILEPNSGTHFFSGPEVKEIALAKYGGLLNKTITCSNCGWEWKAADGGSDVMDCHKCGGKGLVKAQEAGQNIIKKNVEEEGLEYLNKVKDWYNSYTKSPGYLENLKKSGYKDPQAIIDRRLLNISNTGFRHDENRLGTYYNNRANRIHYSPIKDQINFPGDDIDTTLSHEVGHSSVDIADGFFQGFKPNYNKYDFEQLIKRKKKNIKNAADADENYADQKAIQYEAEKQGLYKAGYGEFTEEIFDKLKNSGIKERALKHYSKEDLIWLLNNIAQNDNNQSQLPIAQEGMQTRDVTEELTDEELQKKIDEYHTQQLENLKKLREEERIQEEIKKKQRQEEEQAFIKQNFNPDAIEKRKNLFDKVVSENEYPTTSFHEEWMNSPQYEKLLRESTRENNSFDLYNDIRNRNLEDLKGKKTNTSEDNYRPATLAYFSPKKRGIYYPFDSNELDTSGGNFSSDFNRGTLVHEKSHFIDNLFGEGQKKFRLNSKQLRNEFKKREDDEISAIPKKDVDLINSLKLPKTDANKFKYDYFTEPTEVRARLNNIRDVLYNSGNKEFLNRDINEEDLKSLYDDIDLNTNEGLRDLNDYFGKENTLKLFNSISQNDRANNQLPVAQMGGAGMMYADRNYQVGGLTKYQTKGQVQDNSDVYNKYTSSLQSKLSSLVGTTFTPNLKGTQDEGKETLNCIGGSCNASIKSGVNIPLITGNDFWDQAERKKIPFMVYANPKNKGDYGEALDYAKPGDFIGYSLYDGKTDYLPAHTNIFVNRFEKDGEEYIRTLDAYGDEGYHYKDYKVSELVKGGPYGKLWLGRPTRINGKNLTVKDLGLTKYFNDFSYAKEVPEDVLNNLKPLRFTLNKDFVKKNNLTPEQVQQAAQIINIASTKKRDIIENTGMSEKTYDILAQGLPGIVFNETRLGDTGIGRNIYEFAKTTATKLSKEGASEGPFQIRHKMMFKNPQTRKVLETLGITSDNYSPSNLGQQVVMAMVLFDNIEKTSLKDFDKPKTVKYPAFSIEAARARGYNPDTITPKQLKDIQHEVVTNKKNNKDLSLFEKLIYLYNAPSIVSKGEAQGDLEYSKVAKNFLNMYLPKKQVGGLVSYQQAGTVTKGAGKDIKIQNPDGTIKIINTGSPEYEKMYKAGNIQSPGAGEDDNPLFGGELPEVVVQQEMTPLLKAKRDYEYMSNKEAFINRKKDEYLKSLGRQNWFGASRSHFPEKVLSRILREYDYKQNTRALEDVAKVKGFDLNTRGEWIYDLTPAERKALINSKYSAQLNPNEFAEMASGAQQLANTLIPFKPLNFKIPGLTQRELKEDRESPLSPLKVLAPLNMPGNYIANAFRNIPNSDVVETPWFGMQRMGDVSELESMMLNPLNITMVEGAANLLTKLPAAARALPSLARTAGRALSKEKGLLSNAYKINPWATKIDDAASKIVGEGTNSFIYDVARPMYHRAFEAKPNFLTGYKQIKKPNQFDFSPIIDARTKEFKNKAFENFKNLTGGKADDIDLQQFVDYFKAEQERQNLKFDYQNFLTDINREKFYDTPEWHNVWDNARDQAENLFQKIEKTLQQKSSPLGKRLGSGAEGSVYELANDPAYVIKIGQTFKTSSADDLVKSFEGIKDDNIARVLRAHKDGRNLIEIMPNLNVNPKFSNFTKEQVLEKLEKDAKLLMDKGFRLDIDNISGNFSYNDLKNKVDIYDISKPAAGQTGQNPDAVLKYLRNFFDDPYKIPTQHRLYDPNLPTPEYKQGGLTKYQNAGAITSEERKPYMGYPPVNGKWLGNKLTKEGYITSTTKGGNYTSFTGNDRADDWINKQIDTGKFGFDPKTMTTFLLKKPVKGLSKEDQFMATETFYNLMGKQGFTSDSQSAQIKKLPEWQQKVINDANTKMRKVQVRESMKEVYKHPLWYGPGMVAAGIPAVAALEVAGAAAAPYITAALATQLPGMAAVPGATFGNAITTWFAAHGLTHIGPDAVKMYKNPSWKNADSLGMDILEIAPIVGPAAKTIGEGLSATKRALTFEQSAIAKLDDIRNIGPKLEAEIASLKQQETLAEESRKALYADYKAGKITAEQYTTGAKQLNPNELLESRNVLEKQLRDYNIKQDIANASQQNILKSENQLGKNISDGGSNTKGVFELGDDYVARLSAHGYDDSSRLVNYANKIKSPRIAKTLQVKEINGKVYQVQNKATGTPITQLSEQEFKNIPKEHVDNFWKDKAELDELGLSIDISGGKSNILYDPKKGFQIIDLGIGTSPTNQVISDTYKGLSTTGKVENAAIDYANPIKDLATTFKNRNKKLITIGAENLDKELLKKITQLESPEGFNRLVAQEAEMLKRDFPGMVDLENKAISNAQTRISELYQTALQGNFNANYLEAKKLNSALTPQKFGIPRNNAFFRPGLGSSNFSDSVIDLSKANSPAELRNNIFAKEFYGIEMPGEIAISREYAEGMPVYDHEINHLLQNTRNTALDDMLRKYFNNSQNLLKDFSQKTNKAYNYFRKSKHGVPSKEPSSFLAEARRAMLERGLIKDIYEPITPKKVFDAMKHFKTQPYKNPYTDQSYHRIFDFANDSPQTLKFLSDAFNKLPAILPIGLTVGAGAAVLPKEKQGGTVGKQKKALSWLNS